MAIFFLLKVRMVFRVKFHCGFVLVPVPSRAFRWLSGDERIANDHGARAFRSWGRDLNIVRIGDAPNTRWEGTVEPERGWIMLLDPLHAADCKRSWGARFPVMGT